MSIAPAITIFGLPLVAHGTCEYSTPPGTHYVSLSYSGGEWRGLLRASTQESQEGESASTQLTINVRAYARERAAELLIASAKRAAGVLGELVQRECHIPPSAPSRAATDDWNIGRPRTNVSAAAAQGDSA